MPNMNPMSQLRSQLPAAGDPKNFLTRLAAPLFLAIEAHLTIPSDDSDMCESKLAVFFACLALSLRGLTWGAMYVFLGAYWSCISPFLLVLTNFFGLLHMCITKQVSVARHGMVYSLAFCSLYVHWSLGCQSGTVMTWSLLAPQLVILTGGTIATGLVLFMVSTAVLTTLLVLQCMGLMSNISPQGVLLSSNWVAIFELLNVLFPALISFILIWLIMVRMRKHRGQLERSVAKAEVMGQMIVDFNLDSIDAIDEMKDDRMLHILKQAAFNLRLYRPFIPSHLLNENILDSDPQQLDDVLQPNSPAMSQIPIIPDMFSCDLRSHPPTTLFSVNSAPLSPLCNLRAPGGVFGVPHQVRIGSLLYVQLHQLELYAQHSMHYDKLDCIHRTSTLFVEIVAGVLKETQGVLQSIEPNACLISWNFISTCRMHAENACHAALLIKDRLKMGSGRADLAPLTVSMGLWSGSLVSGTFGTAELKSHGVTGSGVRRAMDLQHYAALHRYAIVANAEIFQLTSVAPRIKLVPIDIIATEDPEPGRSARNFPIAVDTELLYEVVSFVPVDDDEWMYQLQAATGLCNPVHALVTLLTRVGDGVSDFACFQAEISQLIGCGDVSVAAVAMKLDKLHRQGAFSRPHYTQLFRIWATPSSFGPGSPCPLCAPHRSSHLSAPTFHLPHRASYSSICSEHSGNNVDSAPFNQRASIFSPGGDIIFSAKGLHLPVHTNSRATGGF